METTREWLPDALEYIVMTMRVQAHEQTNTIFRNRKIYMHLLYNKHTTKTEMYVYTLSILKKTLVNIKEANIIVKIPWRHKGSSQVFPSWVAKELLQSCWLLQVLAGQPPPGEPLHVSPPPEVAQLLDTCIRMGAAPTAQPACMPPVQGETLRHRQWQVAALMVSC